MRKITNVLLLKRQFILLLLGCYSALCMACVTWKHPLLFRYDRTSITYIKLTCYWNMSLIVVSQYLNQNIWKTDPVFEWCCYSYGWGPLNTEWLFVGSGSYLHPRADLLSSLPCHFGVPNEEVAEVVEHLVILISTVLSYWNQTTILVPCLFINNYRTGLALENWTRECEKVLCCTYENLPLPG